MEIVVWGGGYYLDNNRKEPRRLKKIVVSLISIVTLITVVSFSYAWWTTTTKQNEMNILGTSCLKIEMDELSEAISLKKAYPLTDKEGEKLEPFHFRIRNICNTGVDYKVNIEVLQIDGKRIESKNIAVKIDKKVKKKLTEEYSTSKIETEDYEAIEAYNIYKGTLTAYANVEHEVRLWMDESADNDSQNGKFEAKVVITGDQNEIAQDGDIQLAMLVDGKMQEEMPNKEEENYAVEVKCDKGSGKWNQETWGVEITGIEKNQVSCNIEFTTLEKDTTIDFDYTGKEEAISLPKGNYKLEVWGAQGGAESEEAKNIGGLGGYSVGEYTISSSDTLFVNVGGQGSNIRNNNEYFGGYNGGGTGNTVSQIGFGGGGATHIAKVSGLLSTLESQKEQVLIVAGGGGGNGGTYSYGNDIYGGSGGGFKGKDGYNNIVNTHPNNSSTNYTGIGGSQNEGGYEIHKKSENAKGKFGQGGNYYYIEGDRCGIDSSIGGCGGAGGGGGYFGGGGSSRGHAGGGGGSGYIGNPLLTNKAMYCYQCTTSDADETKTYTTDSVSSEAISQNAKQGDGYARITYLGNN